MNVRPRILVVDDARGIRLLLDRALSSLGYEIETAIDGRDALRAFQDTRPDVVITDMVMPGMTGWELAGYLRGIDAAVPIVLFSAHAGTGTLKREAERMGLRFLQKPQPLHEIASLVGELVTAVRMGRPAPS